MVLTSTTDVYKGRGGTHFTWHTHTCTLNMQQQELMSTYRGPTYSDSLSLNMKTLRFFETSVITQQHRRKMATSMPQALTRPVHTNWHESVGAADQHTSKQQCLKHMQTWRHLHTTAASAYRINLLAPELFV